MNIIGNSCTASYIVRDLLKAPFNNPFVWCSVSEADILFTIEHFTNIQWDIIKTELYENKTFHTKNVKIVIDNRIEIKYPHYCLSNAPTKVDGINVFSKDIIEWAASKYHTRLNRMQSAGMPFFILGGSWEDQQMSLSTQYKFKSANNIYILDTTAIKHDNYKVAVKNFNAVHEKLMTYVNSSILPSA